MFRAWQHLYSNSNYIVLAELVAKASGQSFVEYTDAMFQRLGMPDTSFESDHTTIRGPVAKPYFNFQTWKTYDWLPDLVGDGALFSTLDDQLQWECLVQGSGETEFDRALIERSQQIVNAELSEQYGFGLEHRNEGGLKTKYHEGSTGAWKAYSLRYPDQKFSMVTLSNSGKTIPSMQSRQMVEVLLEMNADTELKTVRTQPERTGSRVEVEEIPGTYTSSGGFYFQFVKTDEKLFLRRDGRSDVLLERESSNVFHEVNDPGFKQEFTKNENEEMQVTAYHTSHAPYSLTRPNNNLEGFDFKRLNGVFTNFETGGEIEIEHVDDQQYTFTIKGKKARKAQLVSPNRLVSGSYVIQWTGRIGQDTNLMLNTSRVRNVKFSRQSVNDKDAQKLMSRRSSYQQEFLFEYMKSNPPATTSTEDRLRWMDEAEEAFAMNFRSRTLPGAVDGSRVESFSPYVWSLMPQLVADGSPGEEVSNRTKVERVFPAMLSDLETVVEQREPGACELLRIPDIGNGLSRANLLIEVEQSMLERFQTAVDKLPAAMSEWKTSFEQNETEFPKHLRSALPQLRTFADLIDVELALRTGQLEQAQSRISAMATPGLLPSGFRSFIQRLARQYRDANECGSALAVLDLGLLSTTQGDWPASELRSLYEECGGRTSAERFELAISRRAAPLVPTKQQFDVTNLVDIESGKPLDPDMFVEKTLVLDFVARRCAPCLEAIPKLQAFDESQPEVAVITVVVGESKDRSAVLKSVRDRGGEFTMVYDTADWMQKLNVYGYPSYVVVSPDRTVLKPFGLRIEATHSFDDVVGTIDRKE